MTDDRSVSEQIAALAILVSRRRLLLGLGAGTLALGLPGEALVAAQEATPAPTAVDQARLNGLVELSRTLCGGGNFDPGRATTLLGLLDGDATLTAGLTELLAAPPVDPALATTPPAAPASVPSVAAQGASQAILLYWYAGEFNGDPVTDRATVYYGLTAWQAMYTPPFAVCKLFGGWADPPALTPLVAGV